MRPQGTLAFSFQSCAHCLPVFALAENMTREFPAEMEFSQQNQRAIATLSKDIHGSVTGTPEDS